ncbi:MAG: PKD domain-containing protein, partial [Nanoarchaeota archaeon]
MILALAGTVFGITIIDQSPTKCLNGGWSNCNEAQVNGGSYAQSDDAKDGPTTAFWSSYGINIPAGSAVTQVIARVDANESNTGRPDKLIINVSNDNGVHFGPAHIVADPLTGPEKTYSIDITNDYAWTSISISKLNISATCSKASGGSSSSSNQFCRIDWLPVNITYTPFDYSLSANPSSGSAVQRSNISTNISSSLIGGLKDLVALSVSGCPPTAHCNLNTSTINSSSGSANLIVQITPQTSPGLYNISINGSANGINRSTYFNVTVTDSLPVANASANVTSDYAPSSVQFSGSVAGGDAPLSYFWDFGDSSTSSSQNPEHTYSSAGIYNATFTVTDFDGDTSNSSVLITVGDFAVNASPSADSVAQARNKSTDTTVFLISGVSIPVDLSLVGCPPNAACSFDTSSGSPTFTVNLTVSTTNTTPAGIYSINLTGTGNGKKRNATYTLNVTDSQPIASISAYPEAGYVPLDVQFNGSTSSGDGPFTFYWDFGDASTSNDQNPIHTFTSPGAYPVSLTVTDFDGDSDTVFKDINVGNFIVTTTPSSDSVVQARSQSTTVDVTLTASPNDPINLSADGCPTNAVCSFSPDNGSPTFSSNFTVSTSSTTPAAVYDINITGSNGNKQRSTIYILTVTDSQPVATVGANTTSGISSFFDVFFELNFTGGDDPFTFNWDFNDSTSASTQNATHSFAPGVYNVSGTVTDFDGDSSTDHVLITVVAPSCGDSIVNQQNESCDDGNSNNSDSCTNACQLPACGDGFVQPSNNEVCDDSNTANGDGCNSVCQVEFCGDNTINNNGAEQCDNGDGNTNNTCNPAYASSCQVCSTTCTNLTFNGAFCGDGVKNGPEQCDTSDGVGAHQSCSQSCVLSDLTYCGDGTKQNPNQEGTGGPNNDGQEACDGTDGVGLNESCTQDCTIQSNGPVCGNDILEQGEACDDGNTQNNDGCNEFCEVEGQVPEFSGIASGLAVAGAGIGYI